MPQYEITTRATGRRPDDNPLGMWAAMARQGRLRDEVVDQETADTLSEARDWAAWLIESRTNADPDYAGMYADAQVSGPRVVPVH
jgi:hypothetical protein